MRVLVACEYSGTVRDAFRARGHDAWSCDLLLCDADPAYHLQGNVLDLGKSDLPHIKGSPTQWLNNGEQHEKLQLAN